MNIQEGHSKNSVITAMNQFISSVDEMDSTVLVPRRLMDIPALQLKRTQDKDSSKIVQDNTDLFKFFTMLVETRDEIKWGRLSTCESSSVYPIAQQLQQFGLVLRELTDMAVRIKDRYENDVNNVM